MNGVSAPADRAMLGTLSPQEREARFDALQQRMPEVWRIMGLNEAGESVVVVPSVSLDRIDQRGGTLLQAYEERFLFLLLLLRQPRLRMIYVTSKPIAPTSIDYYLALLPGVIPSHARSRLSPRARARRVASPAHGEAARAPAAARAHPCADPRPGAGRT